MPYDEKLADRIREALVSSSNVVEKKMFRGLCFMVNGKMCISLGKDEIMCRIDPELNDEVLEMDGCRPMIRLGKVMKGFVFVSDQEVQTNKDLSYWIKLCLDFNKTAKATRPKKNSKKKEEIINHGPAIKFHHHWRR